MRDGSILAAVEQDDLGAALHAEVARLPSKYRAPVVLCYFEGRTHDEAAAALRCPVGTVRSRLSRAREMLRGRLVRRGVAPAVVAGMGSSAWAEVPAALRRATLAAAVDGAPAPVVAALAHLVARVLLAARPRMAAAVLALVAVSAGLAIAFGRAGATPDGPPAAAVGHHRPDDTLPDHARARLGSRRSATATPLPRSSTAATARHSSRSA